MNHTTKDVARELNVSVITVRRLIERGEIEAHKVGRVVRITDQALEAYQAKNRIPIKRQQKEHDDARPRSVSAKSATP